MFTVVITEKGGAQRKLEFTESEVTIGRVQGNDIVLPKGNVSKRHSRIVLKDNRFIVVDLKSTNGTYVNGRKITSPLVVKEGDKIYIGDFILTLEGNASASGSDMPQMRAPSKMPSAADPGYREPSLTPPPTPHLSSMPPGPSASVPGERPPLPSAPPHKSFPPAREPEPPLPKEPPPRSARPAPVGRTEAPASMPPVLGASNSSIPPGMRDDLNSLMQRLGGELDAEATEAGVGADSEARRRALHAIEGVIGKLQDEGTISPGVDRRRLAEAALAEATGLGPLATLLADADVRHVIVERHDVIRVDRGEGLVPAEVSFPSAHALAETARRLCARASHSDAEGISEITLPEGGHALIMWPPAVTGGPVISVRRRPAQPPVIEDLGAEGIVDPDQAEAVTTALRERRNVLFVGPAGSGVERLLGAALASCPDSERVAVVERHPEVALGKRAAVCLGWGRDPVRVLEHLDHFAPDRLVLHGVGGDTCSRVLHLLASRRDGSLCSMQAGSAQAALDELNAAASGVQVSQAIQLIAECERTRDGGSRLAALYELEGGSLRAL